MDSPFPQRKPRVPRASWLLSLDSWVDTTLYESSFAFRERWENITIFFRRFKATGWRRAVVEFASEGFTLGTAASVVVLALAIPAFEKTQGQWLTQGDFAVTFLDRYGQEIGSRGIIQRDSVPVDEMPDHVIQAVLATEDRRFFDHWGIDFLGLARALTENARAGGVVQGGSTLTQQLAKNLFLSNDRTIERKVTEAFLSVWLEMNLSKTEILQLYLDRAYMGGGTHGITAAADFYFGKEVKDLTLAESAMLAGLFKAPQKYAPHVDLPAARARANVVLSALVDSGFMTEGQVIEARLRPADVVDRDEKLSPDYFLDWAFEEAKRIAGPLGVRAMVARTTVDMGLQRAAEEAVEFHLRQHGQEYRVTEGAVVVMDTNGAVRAIVGGRDYGVSQFNRATKALRQAGSSFKPYVYAAAMLHGFTPDDVISDGPVSWGNWSPQNYTRDHRGKMTLATALIKSINTVPVRLAKDHLGIDVIKEIAVAMGVESPLNGHKTMVLGTSELTVMDQATGYNTFANGGWAGTRHGITQITTHGGEVVYDHGQDAPKPRQVLPDPAVASMNSILVQIPETGTARRAALPGIRSAGKTGTTQSYRDAWYVGFTGNYTAAVWLGNDDFTTTNEMTGGSLPAMVWKRLMETAHRNVILKPIPGLEEPFLPADAVAKAKEQEQKKADEGDLTAAVEPLPEAPRVLSVSTTQALRSLADRFAGSPTVASPAEPLSPTEPQLATEPATVTAL
ncbi:MAG TPA: PBP1A family penicillin-binding protein [Mesorhizobium sp.]|jgi:penicillin-binding protein 1A|nr:PBP1A family penicillin-binding protein [Mesorhizobium sp.]